MGKSSLVPLTFILFLGVLGSIDSFGSSKTPLKSPKIQKDSKSSETSTRSLNPGRVIIPSKQRPEVLNHFDEDAEEEQTSAVEVDENEEVEVPKEAPGFKRNAILIGVAMGTLAVGVILYSLYLSKNDS